MYNAPWGVQKTKLEKIPKITDCSFKNWCWIYLPKYKTDYVDNLKKVNDHSSLLEMIVKILVELNSPA